MFSDLKLLVWGLLGIVSVVIVLLTSLLLGVVAGVAALAVGVLGVLPWTYDKWNEHNIRVQHLKAVSGTFSTFVEVIQLKLPAIVSSLGNVGVRDLYHGAGVLETILANRDGPQEIDLPFLEELGEGAIESTVRTDVAEEWGMEVLRSVVLHLSIEKLDRRLGLLAKASVRSFLGEQTRFGDTGLSLTSAGTQFEGIIAYLRQHRRIDNVDTLRKGMMGKMTEADRDRLTAELSDPYISFLVYELGKADDLLDLVNREMSGMRLVGQLAKRAGGVLGEPRKRYDTFLVLKQELRGGRRYMKERIDAVPDRIIGFPSYLYMNDKYLAPRQTMNVLRLPTRYANGKDFCARHFPQTSKFTDEELERSGMVAVPLATNDAYYFPEDESVLRFSHKDVYTRWGAFFGKDRRVVQRIISDFSVSFLDLVKYLTLDFLVKTVGRGEKNYLRENTNRVLSNLGLTSLLELARVSPHRLHALFRELGYPSYYTEDLESLVGVQDQSFREYLDIRLGELSNEVVKNASRISKLQAMAT